jgi:hypothetical protein
MMRNPHFSRRTLLRGLSLGAAATALGPLVNRMVREAHGQSAKSLRLLIVSHGNGMWPLENMDFIGDIKSSGYIERQDIVVPPMFQVFAEYQSRMLYVDGLPQREYEDGHNGGPQVFSGTANRVTVDQWIAQNLATDAPFKWIGVTKTRNADQTLADMNACKEGGERVPFVSLPSAAFAAYFGGGDQDESVRERLSHKRQRLLDFAKDDVLRVEQRLVGAERQRFQQYLTSIEELDRRHKLQGDALLNCNSGTASDPARWAEGMSMQYDIAATALACGLSRIVWINAGGSKYWEPPRDYSVDVLGGDVSIHDVGHGHMVGPLTSKEANTLHIQWQANQTARVLSKLAQATTAEGSVLDETLVMFINENGYKHHNRGGRYPVLFMGNASGKLKADGRYVRFPLIPDWDKNKIESGKGEFGLPQLWNTLAHVFGVPKDDFGQGGPEENRGVLEQLLV